MKRVGIAIGAIVCAYVLAVSFLLLEYYNLFHFLGPGLFRSAMFRAALWLSVLPLSVIFMRPVVNRAASVLVEAAALTAICFAAALTAETIYLLYGAAHGWYQRAGSPERQTLDGLVPSLLASVHAPFAFLICATMAMRFLEGSADQRAAEARLNRLETRLVEARTQLLRSQLHPHFLFNALNSVAALIRSEPDRAAQMLDRLGRFYEIASATEGKTTVTLAEELDFARQYIEIEKIRFGPRLTTIIQVPSAVMHAEIPTLILQPIVENAITHGIGRHPGPGTILIGADNHGDRLRVIVDNSGALERPPVTHGVGLTNTRQRLDQLYGESADISMTPIDGGTRVMLTIPFRARAAA